tara:strand:+ start:35826 stop:36803 length:978 start_codon:yes stop_codon:yes gene_type:complete
MYILEMGKLQIGDIILTAQAGFTSKAVRLSTNCQFSHAILYVGEGSYIHSDSLGVHSNNIQRLLFEKPSHVEVRRLKDKTLIDRAVMFARSQIGTRYSIKESVRTKNPIYNTGKAKTKKQFCSRLVAQSYEYAGIKLVKNSDYCSPKDLQNSTLTDEINDVLRAANNSEICFANSPSPLQRQAEVTNHILDSVRKLTLQDVQNFEELDTFVIENPTYDKEITNIVRASGYLTLFNHELTQNPWRYDGQLFLSIDEDTPDKRKRAKFELDSAKDQVGLYSHNYLMCQNIRGRFSLVYFEMKMALYRSLIELMNKRIKAAEYVLENS